MFFIVEGHCGEKVVKVATLEDYAPFWSCYKGMDTWLSQYYENWQEETMSVQRRKYDPDFKRNAVCLAEDLDQIDWKIQVLFGGVV